MTDSLINHYCVKQSDSLLDLKWENERLLQNHWKCLRLNTRLFLTIEVYVPKRSLQQNKYLWSVVYAYFSEAMGIYDKDEIHNILTNKFLSEQHPDYPELTITKSTTKLTVREFWDYVESCRQLYREYFNGEIPDPYIMGYREK
jgi:hypothetical protein